METKVKKILFYFLLLPFICYAQVGDITSKIMKAEKEKQQKVSDTQTLPKFSQDLIGTWMYLDNQKTNYRIFYKDCYFHVVGKQNGFQISGGTWKTGNLKQDNIVFINLMPQFNDSYSTALVFKTNNEVQGTENLFMTFESGNLITSTYKFKDFIIEVNGWEAIKNSSSHSENWGYTFKVFQISDEYVTFMHEGFGEYETGGELIAFNRKELGNIYEKESLGEAVKYMAENGTIQFKNLKGFPVNVPFYKVINLSALVAEANKKFYVKNIKAETPFKFQKAINEYLDSPR